MFKTSKRNFGIQNLHLIKRFNIIKMYFSFFHAIAIIKFRMCLISIVSLSTSILPKYVWMSLNKNLHHFTRKSNVGMKTLINSWDIYLVSKLSSSIFCNQLPTLSNHPSHHPVFITKFICDAAASLNILMTSCHQPNCKRPKYLETGGFQKEGRHFCGRCNPINKS